MKQLTTDGLTEGGRTESSKPMFSKATVVIFSLCLIISRVKQNDKGIDINDPL